MKAPRYLVAYVFFGGIALAVGAVAAMFPALGMVGAWPFLAGASLVVGYFIPQAQKAVQKREHEELLEGARAISSGSYRPDLMSPAVVPPRLTLIVSPPAPLNQVTSSQATAPAEPTTTPSFRVYVGG